MIETLAASSVVLTTVLCLFAVAGYRKVQSLAERLEILENRSLLDSGAPDGIAGKLDVLLEKVATVEQHLISLAKPPANSAPPAARTVPEEERPIPLRADTNAANPTLERRREILKLSKAGYTAAQIASFLQLPASEVELLLKVLQVSASDSAPARPSDGQPAGPAVRARSVAF